MTDSPFQFIGEALAFDFINTETVKRKKLTELLNTPADVVAWWHEAVRHYHMDQNQPLAIEDDVFETVKVLRSSLRRIFTAVVTQTSLRSTDLDVLNGVLKSGYSRLIMTADGHFKVRLADADESPLLLTIAQSATALLTECPPERLHQCKNGQCIRMFLDTTKNGNRVWCSVACMNRARSIEHYHQLKA